MRYDASQRLAFGLCKKYGINLPKGATPKDAWEALKDKTGKSAQDFYAKSGKKGADKVRFGTSNRKIFSKNLLKAKSSQNQRKAWRVTGMSREELKEEHPNAKFHVTDGGSTIAIDNGDIVGLCKAKGDPIKGKTLLEYAVKNGGVKLDSYEGNHLFYVQNGFEPVSWCKWDPKYEGLARAQGWDPSKGDKREAIVFYKYVGIGKVKNKNLREWKKAVPASVDYPAAYDERDKLFSRGKKK